MTDESWHVPLPKVPHMVLLDSELESRLVIVGDVHGCLDELKILLESCKRGGHSISVILVGDLVNKGPLSAEVVSFARTSGFFSVRGNHDDTALSYVLGTNRKDRDDSYSYVDTLSRDDVAWLMELPYTISIPSMGLLVVHAGIVPYIPLPQQTRCNLVTMRNVVMVDSKEFDHMVGTNAGENTYSSSRYTGAAKPSDGEAWAKVWSVCAAASTTERGASYAFPHVYFGHDAKRGLQQYECATGLDTGCVYGRKLTGVVLPDRKIVQVDALRMYVKPAEDD